MAKFKVGELCLVVGKPCKPSDQRVIGEVVTVVRVSRWWRPIHGSGRKWDYEIQDAGADRYWCMESALRKLPPPDAPGSWAVLRELGWTPPVKRGETA